MNKERILALADLIETISDSPNSFAIEGFDMRYVTHECGTPSCIAGWAAWEAQGRPEYVQDPNVRDFYSIERQAAEYLGLPTKGDNTAAFPLFYPQTPSGKPLESYDGITAKTVAKTLRHFAATGEIIW